VNESQKLKQPYENYFSRFASDISEQCLQQAEGLLNQLAIVAPEIIHNVKNKNARILGESLTLFCTWLNCHCLWLKRIDAHKVFAEQVTERIWMNFHDDLQKEIKYSPMKEQLEAWKEDIELQCLDFALQLNKRDEKKDAYEQLAQSLFKSMGAEEALVKDQAALKQVSKILQALEVHIKDWHDLESQSTEFCENEVFRYLNHV